jgi:hypothetical protein
MDLIGGKRAAPSESIDEPECLSPPSALLRFSPLSPRRLAIKRQSNCCGRPAFSLVSIHIRRNRRPSHLVINKQKQKKTFLRSDSLFEAPLDVRQERRRSSQTGDMVISRQTLRRATTCQAFAAGCASISNLHLTEGSDRCRNRFDLIFPSGFSISISNQ